MTTARRIRRRSPRRRDRRGRGLRGLIYPASTPAARTRAERFDALVLAVAVREAGRVDRPVEAAPVVGTGRRGHLRVLPGPSER